MDGLQTLLLNAGPQRRLVQRRHRPAGAGPPCGELGAYRLRFGAGNRFAPGALDADDGREPHSRGHIGFIGFSAAQVAHGRAADFAEGLATRAASSRSSRYGNRAAV